MDVHHPRGNQNYRIKERGQVNKEEPEEDSRGGRFEIGAVNADPFAIAFASMHGKVLVGGALKKLPPGFPVGQWGLSVMTWCAFLRSFPNKR